MTKKKMDLGAAMGATVNKVPSVDAIFEAPTTTAKEEATAQLPPHSKKRGRPKTEKPEKRIAVTFQIPESLYYELKVAAAQMRTTQQFIVIDALVDWLDK